MTAAVAEAESPDLVVVGDNIKKEDAYLQNKSGELERIAQGVYLPEGMPLKKAFEIYGMRMAQKFFPNAVLTHSTAWYLKPVDDRIFIGGDYPYKKQLVDLMEDGEIYEARIVQSKVHPDIKDKRLYEPVIITDPQGKMRFMRATLELQLLQQMDSTKVHPEKHVSEDDVLKMWTQLTDKYDGSGHAWQALAKVAIAADKENEAKRFKKRYFDGSI